MVKEINENIAECNKCHTRLSFNNNDVKTTNQGAWEEYYINCPKCGNRIEVCYMNGQWKSRINNSWW